MKIFLEGTQPQFSPVLSRRLKPGVNDVPDDVGTALVDCSAAYCAQVKEDDETAEPIQLFRIATEKDEEVQARKKTLKKKRAKPKRNKKKASAGRGRTR